MRLPKRLQGKGAMSPAHARSPEQESSLASRVGGSVTRGSGNSFEKGDVRVKGVVRIEAKTTSKGSFSITPALVKKIQDAALPHGELPVIVIEFLTPEGSPCCEVAVVPVWVLDSITSDEHT